MKQTMKANEIWKSTSEALNECDHFDITLEVVKTMKARTLGVRDNLKALRSVTYGVVSEYKSFDFTSVESTIRTIAREAGGILRRVEEFGERAEALLSDERYLDNFEIEVEADERGEVDEYDKQEAIGELVTLICIDLQERELTPKYLLCDKYYELCGLIESLFDDIIRVINTVHSTEEKILERIGIEVEPDYLRDDLRKGLEKIVDFDRDLLPKEVTQDTYCYYEMFD